ncbi:hypothetical protein ERJ75_000916300 [Trypanosoma vivax]|nr:hypothetical protein ERJ75_000916300 [Trypanosoma vivax]
MTYEEAQAVYNPVHSAKVRYQEKCRKYAHWASQNGLNFAPFVLLTNGAVYEQSRTWLRKVIASHDHRLTVTTAYDFVTGDVVAAVLRGNVHVFAVAGPGPGARRALASSPVQVRKATGNSNATQHWTPFR